MLLFQVTSFVHLERENAMNCLFHRISDVTTKFVGAAMSVADPVDGGVRMRGRRKTTMSPIIGTGAGGPVQAVRLPVTGLGVVSPMSGTGTLGITSEPTGQGTEPSELISTLGSLQALPVE